MRCPFIDDVQQAEAKGGWAQMDRLGMVSNIALWVIALIQGCVLVVLVRQIGVLHLRLQPAGARTTNVGPEIGTTLPEIQANDIHGSLAPVITYGRARLLLFIAPPCDACRELLPAAKTIARNERGGLDVVFVTAFEDEAVNRTYVAQQGLGDWPYIMSAHLAQEYGVLGTPYALAVDAEGVVRAKGIVNHIEHLESLVEALSRGQATLDDYVASREGRSSHAP